MALRSFQLLHVASEPRRPLCGRQACRSARQLAGVRVRRNLTAAVLKPRRADQSAAGVVGKEKTTCTRGSKGAGSQCDADRRLRLERSRESTPGQDDCASPSCRSSEERLLDADVLDGARDYPELAAESAGLEKQRGLLEGIWSDDNKRVRGLILLNLLTVLMATNWVIVKDAESALDPMTFAALRFGIAAVGFLPFLRQGMSDEAVRNAGLELGCWSAAGYLTQAVGLMSSDASRASFLSALTVVLVPIFAGLSGRGVRPLTWASALAAVLGVALLGGDSKAPDAGDVWNILSAVFFALQVFRTEVHSREVGTHVAKPLMAVIVTTTVAIAFAADAATHWQQLMSTSLPTLLQSWWAEAPQLPMKELLYTGLLSTDLVLLIELVALSDVSSSEAAIIYTLEPVLGGLLGIVVLHEGSHWGPLGWAGATVIVSTSLITQLASNNDKGLGK